MILVEFKPSQNMIFEIEARGSIRDFTVVNSGKVVSQSTYDGTRSDSLLEVTERGSERRKEQRSAYRETGGASYFSEISR